MIWRTENQQGRSRQIIGYLKDWGAGGSGLSLKLRMMPEDPDSEDQSLSKRISMRGLCKTWLERMVSQDAGWGCEGCQDEEQKPGKYKLARTQETSGRWKRKWSQEHIHQSIFPAVLTKYIIKTVSLLTLNILRIQPWGSFSLTNNQQSAIPTILRRVFNTIPFQYYCYKSEHIDKVFTPAWKSFWKYFFDFF